ncbi:MAG: hypothetical protein ACREEJ_15795 [Ensifer adhaerens]
MAEGTGDEGTTEFVVSRDGCCGTMVSSVELDVQPAKARQARNIAGTADKRMSTRTQNIVDGEEQCRRDPIDVKLLTETYRKRLNTIFTTDPLLKVEARRIPYIASGVTGCDAQRT